MPRNRATVTLFSPDNADWVHYLASSNQPGATARQPMSFLKLINNSLSLNKGNHDRDGVWISDLN